MYMEHMTGKQDCVYKDKTYAHGTELCLGDGCMVCNDGQLVEAETNPPIAGVHIDPGKREKLMEI